MWAGGDAIRIIRTLLEALVGMLRLDFVYVRLNGESGEAPIEMAQFGGSNSPANGAQRIGEMLRQSLGQDAAAWAPAAQVVVEGDLTSVVILRLGLQAGVGIIVAGSRRSGFPERTEKLVLSIAANQTAIGLQEARLLGEQKRLADELDRARRKENQRACRRECGAPTRNWRAPAC